MKLRRLYSNFPEIFPPIEIGDGLSVVVAEIRLPSNREKHTHNLGKTTIGQLIDFCLLRTRHPKFFLFKHEDRFSPFTFYLELETDDGHWITVGRSVANASKVALIRSETAIADASKIDGGEWNHLGLAFDRARDLLDSWLGMEALKPWNYRKLIGYLLREQDDYRDVFQLDKFSGKHSDWKPFVAHLLGLDSELVTTLYAERDALESARDRLKTLVDEWGTSDSDTTELDGLIELRSGALESKRTARDSLDFATTDSDVSRNLVEELEASIASLNEERYSHQRDIDRIRKSLSEDAIKFKTRDAERIFAESGVAFPQQIKRTFDELIEFNRLITEERSQSLRDEEAERIERVAVIDRDLARLNAERANALEYLRESATVAKYRALSDEIAVLEGQMQVLQGRRESAERLATLRQEVRSHEEAASALRTRTEKQIASQSASGASRFAAIRRHFGEIVREVVHEDAIIGARFNDAGGLDFYAEFIDGTGAATSADRGTTYRKLLCIAFDLAMLRAYEDVPFPRFVFHDGALEQLEERPRRNLIKILREYGARGLQPVITALDGDLPTGGVATTEVVRTLHDEGPSGLLFRMEPW